ncbi:hypothetical protein SASPL_111783 [Salvia splendens]|uniref:Uncharacterized protein n=1 Tax=Salvia splendens TaxID=180675 RepID=A0A8X8YBD8_SALSN|nr:hypothetical protein SASPL_111783 [Salvia splendens]
MMEEAPPLISRGFPTPISLSPSRSLAFSLGFWGCSLGKIPYSVPLFVLVAEVMRLCAKRGGCPRRLGLEMNPTAAVAAQPRGEEGKRSCSKAFLDLIIIST